MSQSTATVAWASELAGTRWTIDPSHSTVAFTVRHLISKVRGRFMAFTGTVEIPADPLAATVGVEVDLASAGTGDATRDNHLRTSDFFDIENHPTMTFTSTGVTPGEGEEFTLAGTLSLRGVTQPVELAAEFTGAGTDPWGNQRLGFTATAEINRKDFGVAWNAPLETGGVLVGDKVKIEIDVQLVRDAG